MSLYSADDPNRPLDACVRVILSDGRIVTEPERDCWAMRYTKIESGELKGCYQDPSTPAERAERLQAERERARDDWYGLLRARSWRLEREVIVLIPECCC